MPYVNKMAYLLFFSRRLYLLGAGNKNLWKFSDFQIGKLSKLPLSKIET